MKGFCNINLKTAGFCKKNEQNEQNYNCQCISQYWELRGVEEARVRDIDDWDLIFTIANIILIRGSIRDVEQNILYNTNMQVSETDHFVQHKRAGLRDQEKCHFGNLLSHKKPNNIIVLLDYYITTIKLSYQLVMVNNN